MIRTDNSAVISTLQGRIDELEHYNLGLANESCAQQKRIAELESRTCRTCDGSGMLGNAIEMESCPDCAVKGEAHDLRQQAKGVRKAAVYLGGGDSEGYLDLADGFDEEADELENGE